MASLALTRPIYLQERKISPATDLYPASSLTNNLTVLTLSFSRKNCYLTSHFHSWVRCGLFSTARYTALHSKRELPLEHKALFQLLRAPTKCWLLAALRQPLALRCPTFPPQRANPSPLPILLHSLTFNLNSGCPRWRQSFYVVSFAGENCALINTWRSAKKRKGNTNSYVIQLQPSAEFQLCVTCSSSCTGYWRAELGANPRHVDFSVTNVLNTFLMERVWQCRKPSMGASESTEKEGWMWQNSSSHCSVSYVHFLHSGECLWSEQGSCWTVCLYKAQCSGPQAAIGATTIF